MIRFKFFIEWFGFCFTWMVRFKPSRVHCYTWRGIVSHRKDTNGIESSPSEWDGERADRLKSRMITGLFELEFGYARSRIVWSDWALTRERYVESINSKLDRGRKNWLIANSTEAGNRLKPTRAMIENLLFYYLLLFLLHVPH